MSDEYTLTLAIFDAGEARDKLRAATQIVLDKEKAVEVASEEAADAEAVYRAELARAYRAHREAGKPATEADTLARGDCVVYSRERDSKATTLKLAFEKLNDARDSRRSLWRLVEWSRDRDIAQQQGQRRDEREPAGRWP